MNIETSDERLLRTERERDEARAEAERVSESNEESMAMVERLGAEFARLRAAANERAIAELERVRNWLSRRETNSGFTAEYRQCADHAGEMVDANIACLRAEQQAAPAPPPVTPPAASDEAWLRAPLTDKEVKAVEQATGSKVVTPPADAPSRPSVEALQYWTLLLRSRDLSESQCNAVLRLLLDDALAGRGEGAK